MTMISTHISFAEATRSPEAIRLGIDNTPNEQQVVAMELVAQKCFEPLRTHHGKPIGLTSFFRSAELNKAVGGSTTSAHCNGEAIDLDADIHNNGITNAEIFHWLRDNTDFDQLIWEFGSILNPAWVHVAYRASGNRKQVLRAVKRDGITKYIPFLP